MLMRCSGKTLVYPSKVVLILETNSVPTTMIPRVFSRRLKESVWLKNVLFGRN